MTEKDYKNELKNKFIEYRSDLLLDNDVTFGIEIEYENIPYYAVTHYLDTIKKEYNIDKGWCNKREPDLTEFNEFNETMNGEINSPILRNNLNAWKNLKLILELLKQEKGIVTEMCGGHVNIGAHILGYNQEYWRNFFLLWTLYEKEIYKFSSGEYSKVRKRYDNVIERTSLDIKYNIKNLLNYRKDIKTYLNSISPSLFFKCNDISLQTFSSGMYKDGNRIEFRIPNGTLSEEIWQNNINFFSKFVLACKKELDIEKILYKIKTKDHNAIELADYVFNNELDKEYFLIQTLNTNKIYRKQLQPHITYK